MFWIHFLFTFVFFFWFFFLLLPQSTFENWIKTNKFQKKGENRNGFHRRHRIFRLIIFMYFVFSFGRIHHMHKNTQLRVLKMYVKIPMYCVLGTNNETIETYIWIGRTDVSFSFLFLLFLFSFYYSRYTHLQIYTKFIVFRNPKIFPYFVFAFSQHTMEWKSQQETNEKRQKKNILHANGNWNRNNNKKNNVSEYIRNNIFLNFLQ